MKWIKAFRVMRQARNAVRIARALSGDDLLGYVGLQQKRSLSSLVIPGLGLFAAGVLAGAGIGLLMAPAPGRELRRQIGTRYQKVRSRLTTDSEHLRDRIVSVEEEEYPSHINESAQQSQSIDERIRGPAVM